ncbi:hypothetical protein ACSBR1_028163 [Camellia fascicularis]
MPGMRLRMDRKIGWQSLLYSWTDNADPRPGMFSEGIDPEGRPGIFIWKQHDPYWRSSVYDYSLSYAGYKSPEFASYFTFIAEGDEIYLTFSVSENLINIRAMLTPRGQAELLLWEQSNNSWVVLWQVPLVKCDFMGIVFHLVAVMKMVCINFAVVWRVLSPKIRKNGSLEIGQDAVPGEWHGHNCTCTAYAYTNVSSEAVSCMHWFGDIMDLKGNDINGKDLYVRIHDSDQVRNGRLTHKSRSVIAIAAASISTGLLLFCSFGYVLRRRMRGRGRVDRSAHELDANSKASVDDSNNGELLSFSLRSILAATDNFSEANKLGEGGYGPVDKAWENWKQGSYLEFIDLSIKDTCNFKEALKSIAVRLVCSRISG